MEIRLDHTDASAIAAALVRARHASGSPAMDMVLTLIVVCDDTTVSSALRAATTLSTEHPARIIGVILGTSAGPPALHARIRVGSETSGESILLRMSGELIRHAESAVMPLLLPDSPVVTWWPGPAPVDPARDPLGALADRRLTDAEAGMDPLASIVSSARAYTPGDTDLSWTRLTPWRALLAAALDQVPARVTGATVDAGTGNPAAHLLTAWLGDRLDLVVTRRATNSERIDRVIVHTEAGDVSIHRHAESSAILTVPGIDPRTIPLPTRPMAELLAEDLRRLDPDEIYGDTVARLLED